MTTQNDIQQIYIGLLGRAADQEGLAYWAEEIDEGILTLEQLRANIVNEQPEYEAVFGGQTRTQVVAQLYRNLFNREPDSEGLDYWVNGGGSSVNIDQLVLALNDGASAADRLVLDNRTEVANYYTEAAGEDFTPATAKAAIAGVDGTAASVAQAKSNIDSGSVTDGQTFTLTAGAPADNITGTSGNDTFRAVTDNSLETADMIDGGAGTDTLNANFDATGAAVSTQPLVNNVEVFNLAVTAGANAFTFDATDVTGAQQIWSNGSTTTGGVITFDNINLATTVGVRNSTAPITVNFADTDGDADAANLALSGAGSSATDAIVTVNDVETVNVASSGSATNFVDVDGDAVETINVSGEASAELSVVTATTLVNLETVNAGDLSGDFVFAAAEVNDLTVTGSSAKNTLNLSGNQDNTIETFGGTDSVTVGNGDNTITTGAGNDEIVVGSGDNTVDAGAGNDTVTIGDGTAATGENNVTLGAGDDTVEFVSAAIGQSSAAASLTTIADFNNEGDDTLSIDLATAPTIAVLADRNTIQTAVDGLGAGATLTDALDLAENTLGVDELTWFEFKGDTYVFADESNAGGGSYTAGDFVIKLAGSVDLEASDFVLA